MGESTTTLQVLYGGAKCERVSKVRLISLGEQSVNIKKNFLQEMTFELGHKELVRLTVRSALRDRGKYKNYSDY